MHLNKLNDKQYDMIFIDAAKAQSMKFFQLYTPLLKRWNCNTDNVFISWICFKYRRCSFEKVKQMVKQSATVQ